MNIWNSFLFCVLFGLYFELVFSVSVAFDGGYRLESSSSKTVLSTCLSGICLCDGVRNTRYSFVDEVDMWISAIISFLNTGKDGAGH